MAVKFSRTCPVEEAACWTSKDVVFRPWISHPVYWQRNNNLLGMNGFKERIAPPLPVSSGVVTHCHVKHETFVPSNAINIAHHTLTKIIAWGNLFMWNLIAFQCVWNWVPVYIDRAEILCYGALCLNGHACAPLKKSQNARVEKSNFYLNRIIEEGQTHLAPLWSSFEFGKCFFLSSKKKFFLVKIWSQMVFVSIIGFVAQTFLPVDDVSSICE